VKRFPRPGNAVAPAVTSDETSEIDRVDRLLACKRLALDPSIPKQKAS